MGVDETAIVGPLLYASGAGEIGLVDVGDAVDAAVVVDVGDGEVGVGVVVVDPEPDVDGDELTGVIVPATDIGDGVNGAVANWVGVGVVSVLGPKAVDVGVVGDVVAVVPCPMAARMPRTPVKVVGVEPVDVGEGVVVVMPVDVPADEAAVPDVARPLDAPVPDVARLLLDADGVVAVVVDVAVVVGDAVGLGVVVGVGVGAFTM